MSSLPSVVLPAAPSIIHLGMDVHKDSITIAVLPAAATTPTRLEKLTNDLPVLKKWLARTARAGDLRACYASEWHGLRAASCAPRVGLRV